MPTPTTAKWPKTKNEDEFEDIVVDFLRVRWNDPNATRNGRRGQRQHGVDVFGRPSALRGKVAGAQCKNTDSIDLAMVIDEVELAKGFQGGLGEFLFVTSADRDATLQADVREHFRVIPAPFPVEVVFWSDITAELAGHPNLVAKHWNGFQVAAAAPSSSTSLAEHRSAPRDEARFERLMRLLPELLNEMAADLRESPFKREFVLLKKRQSYWPDGSEFEYFREDHPDLDGKVRMLEQSGMVQDITTKNVPRFAFAEDFVDFLAERL